MSSVVRGIKKAFKKVGEIVKKIAAPVLAAGAIFLTGGAALGLGAAGAAGAGGAAATAGGLGSGIIGSVLTQAAKQAAVGALAGGVISEVSGGSFSTGAKAGAITGAVRGGLMGGAAHLDRGPVTIDGSTGKSIETPDGVRTYPLPDESSIVAGDETPTSASRGLLSKISQFAKDNPEVTGGLIRGVGSGLSAMAAHREQKDLLREDYRATAKTYEGVDPGRGYGSWEFAYNPKSGRIERVARQ